jgi:hypothetical protein
VLWRRALFSIVVLLAGCSPVAEQPVASVTPTAALTPMPGDWTVTAGTVTSTTGWDTFEVRADGRVSRIEMHGEETLQVTIGTASQGSVRRLYDVMVGQAMATLKWEKYGESSTTLIWTQNEETRRYVWITGTKESPPILAEAYRAAMDVFEEASSENSK